VETQNRLGGAKEQSKSFPETVWKLVFNPIDHLVFTTRMKPSHIVFLFTSSQTAGKRLPKKDGKK
jgi:hypothetical protein